MCDCNFCTCPICIIKERAEGKRPKPNFPSSPTVPSRPTSPAKPNIPSKPITRPAEENVTLGEKYVHYCGMEGCKDCTSCPGCLRKVPVPLVDGIKTITYCGMKECKDCTSCPGCLRTVGQGGTGQIEETTECPCRAACFCSCACSLCKPKKK